MILCYEWFVFVNCYDNLKKFVDLILAFCKNNSILLKSFERFVFLKN